MLTKKRAAIACLLATPFLVPPRVVGGEYGLRRPATTSPPCRTVVELPVVSVVDGLPDPSRAPVPSIPLGLPGQAGPSRTYRGLGAEECATLAAANSEEAAAIEARRASIIAELPKHGSDPSRQMLIKGLGFEAADARNQDASKALTLFYRLAQVQLQGEVLRRSQLEVVEAIGASKEQVDRGLLSAQDVYDALRLRQVDLVARQVELAGTTERLNLSLRTLLAVAPAEGDWLIRPIVPWETILPSPEAGDSVATGLIGSSQLLMLRTIVAEVDRNSQPAVEQLLAAVSPLVGSPSRGAPGIGLISLSELLKSPRSKRDSTENLRMRARQILAWRERTLEAEIRAAVLSLESGLQEIAVARDHHTLRVEELQRLLKKSDRGLTPSLQVATARLELLKTQARWVDLIAELNTRRVELDRLLARYATPAASPPPSMIAK